MAVSPAVIWSPMPRSSIRGKSAKRRSEISKKECEMRQVQVSAVSIGPVINAEDVGDFLREFEQSLDLQVDWHQSEHEPPAAGLSEIANLVSIVADSKELILAAWFLADRYGGPAIEKLRRLIKTSRNNKQTGRPYIPLMIAFGTKTGLPSVSFYFHGEPTEEQLQQQLNAMALILESLPEEALGEMPGPPEYGYFWDDKREGWRGTLHYQAKDNLEELEIWFPPDLLGPWKPER